MEPVVLLLIMLGTGLITFILTRIYYINRLKEIRTMCLSLSQGDLNKRLAVNQKSSHEIALILNEASRRFNSQLKQVSNDKNKFEAILSGMTEGVIVVGANGNLQHISPNIRRMVELRSNQWDDRPYWEIIRHQEINDAIKDALISKKALRREIIDLNLPKTYFNMQISPVLNQSDEVFAVIAVLHDITELKQLELMRAEFVANVSHELKTPLTSIKGYVETLKDAIADDPASVDKFLEIIKRQTTHLENLVNDLLILSSLESSALKMDIAPESIEKIIQSVLQMHKKLIDGSGHHMIINIPSNLPLILADRLRMEQVFLNLIENAIKFTPKGGIITIGANTEGNYLKITVADTGLGIHQEHVTRIFERFYRVDKARSRDTGGTGLGLSIVHQIVSAHQGKINVESIPGAGTIFAIFIPTTL